MGGTAWWRRRTDEVGDEGLARRQSVGARRSLEAGLDPVHDGSEDPEGWQRSVRINGYGNVRCRWRWTREGQLRR